MDKQQKEQLDLIFHFFPALDKEPSRSSLEKLGPLYTEWNEKINVVSRKDIGNVYVRHVLHSLTIVKLFTFMPQAKILDLGTGGGFPCIPLAIAYPETQFVGIDGRRKKITVVNEIASAIGLTNLEAYHQRAEDCKSSFDFVLARGVAPVNQLLHWSYRLLSQKERHAIPNGLIAYKGGDPKRETQLLAAHEYHEITMLEELFPLEEMKEKYILYVQNE